jgi:hypothetical protein
MSTKDRDGGRKGESVKPQPKPSSPDRRSGTTADYSEKQREHIREVGQTRPPPPPKSND